jgi:hypothetical protein
MVSPLAVFFPQVLISPEPFIIRLWCLVLPGFIGGILLQRQNHFSSLLVSEKWWIERYQRLYFFCKPNLFVNWIFLIVSTKAFLLPCGTITLQILSIAEKHRQNLRSAISSEKLNRSCTKNFNYFYRPNTCILVYFWNCESGFQSKLTFDLHSAITVSIFFFLRIMNRLLQC